MSIVVHRCECEHIDIEHAQVHGTCSFGYCKGKCRKTRSAVRGPSEIVTTYNDDSVPVDRLVAPGAQFGSVLGGPTKTCDCSSCRAVFDARVKS